MDENVKKRNEVLAQIVINGLQSRNMSGYYAEDKEAALKQALALIDEESTIAMGGCHSAQEIGLIEKDFWHHMMQMCFYQVQMR